MPKFLRPTGISNQIHSQHELSFGLGGAVFEFVVDRASDPGRHGSVIGIGCVSDLGECLGWEPNWDEFSEFRVSSAGRAL